MKKELSWVYRLHAEKNADMRTAAYWIAVGRIVAAMGPEARARRHTALS